jgi:hypothetical protein
MLPAPPRPVDAFVDTRMDDVLEMVEEGLEVVEEELLGETRMVFPAPPRPVWM